MYMKAIKLASTGSERERLKSKCMKVLARAEEIKQAENWDLPLKQKIEARTSHDMNAPFSNRALSTREQVILLESSKLHGFVFSPWTSEPEEELFQDTGCSGSFLYGLSILMGNLHFIDLYRDSPKLKLSTSQQKYFAGWRRPHEVFRDRSVAGGLPETNFEPNMTATSNIDLVQDVTADCSVVASLCAAVARPGQSFEKVSVQLDLHE